MMHADIFLARHRLMLKLQKDIAPFTPTVRELRDVWYVGNTTAHYTLKQLVTMGLVIVRQRGIVKNYYAVRAKP